MHWLRVLAGLLLGLHLITVPVNAEVTGIRITSRTAFAEDVPARSDRTNASAAG